MSRFVFPIALALLLGLSTAAQALPPDPSTYLPYPCTFLQSFTYNDAVYGAINGRLYWPVAGACVANGAPPANRPVVLFFNGAGYSYFDYDVVGRHGGFHQPLPGRAQPGRRGGGGSRRHHPLGRAHPWATRESGR
jgi:hypothetical protein